MPIADGACAARSRREKEVDVLLSSTTTNAEIVHNPHRQTRHNLCHSVPAGRLVSNRTLSEGIEVMSSSTVQLFLLLSASLSLVFRKLGRRVSLIVLVSFFSLLQALLLRTWVGS